MKKIYSFFSEYGRMGDLSGLFIADHKEVEEVIGKPVYFGEVLGKHSEIEHECCEEDFTVKTEDQEFIKKFIEIMGDGTISGLNPISYWDEDDWKDRHGIDDGEG